MAHGVLLKPLPYPEADRLALVWMTNARINLREDRPGQDGVVVISISHSDPR